MVETIQKKPTIIYFNAEVVRFTIGAFDHWRQFHTQISVMETVT